jgi:hypothetical protein
MPVIAACMLVAPVAAYVSARAFPHTPHYTATATIYFGDAGLDTLIFGRGLLRSARIHEHTVVLVRLLSMKYAFQASAEQLGRSEKTLRSEVQVERAGTNGLRLTGTHVIPYSAAVLANKVAETYVLYRNGGARARLALARRRLPPPRMRTAAEQRRARYLERLRHRVKSTASVAWAGPPPPVSVLTPGRAALWSLALSLPLGLALSLLLPVLRQARYGEPAAGG